MEKYNLLKSIGWIVTGNFIFALSVALFIMPVGLITGGSTGIALVVNNYTGLPVTTFVYIFNITMLILGWVCLGKKFALTTIVSTFMYPTALWIWTSIIGDKVLTDDLLLCAIFSGLGIGAALGIVIRSGASTGGMDIPPLVLQKLFRIPVSVSLYAFDVGILLLQAMHRPAESILYGIVLVMIYTIVLDKMLLIGRTRTEVKIVSEKSDLICTTILHQLDRGVTLLDGEGGYMHHKTKLVLSVISNRELIRLEKLVHTIDPECFMVVSRVSEVRGRGFSLNKKYQ